MSRRRKKSRKHRLPDPLEVLEGRVEVRPAQLFDLIHQVNPSGRELDEAEAGRRYRLKHRLQSLLIRSHGDRHLEVVAGGDGVVSLEHRSGTRDAGHAVLDELDPDARSWVQRRLDAPEESPVAERVPERTSDRRPSSAGAERSPAELVARARRSLQDFDYEAAERDLSRAFELSAGGVEAATGLLDLWVERLGDDLQALELEPRLGPAARSDPAVRTHLALAAARGGEPRKALELVAGVDRPAAAAVYVALVGRALGDGEAEEAERHLAAARSRDPAHPELQRLDAAVRELRAASYRPAEEALLERCRRLGAAAVEDQARELQRRWPVSEVARRVLRQADAERRQGEIDASLALGTRALAEERFADAAAHWQRALDHGCEDPGLAARIEGARRRDRRRQERREVERAAARFAGGDPAAALRGYLALDEPLRRELRRAVDRSALEWLEELRAPASGGRSQAAVAAVLALERATAAFAAGDPETADAELAPHLQALRPVAAARRLADEVRSRRDRARRQSFLEVLAKARAAFDGARLDAARELVESVDLAALDAADRSRAEELRHRVLQAQELELRAHEYERHLAADELLEARQLAASLAELAAADGERQRWARRRDGLRQRLREAWRLEAVDEAPGAAATPLAALHDVSAVRNVEGFKVWLDDAGREAVLAVAWRRWLFLRRLDVRRSRLLASASLRVPEPLGELLAVLVDGDRLRIVGDLGGIVEIDRDSWDILGWRSLRQLLAPDTTIELAAFLPRGEYLWLVTAAPDGKGTTSIVELDHWRLGRAIPSRPWVMPLWGPGEPLVLGAAGGRDGGGALYTARGVLAEGGALPDVGRVNSAAVAPDGQGLVAVAARIERDGWETGDVDLVRIGRRGDGELALAATFELPDPSVHSWHSLATSLDLGLVFVLLQTCCGESLLLALDAADEGFQERYRVELPFDAILVQDRRARRVVALFAGERALATLPLGPEPPVFDHLPGHSWRRCRLPEIDEPLFCAPKSRVRADADLPRHLRALRRRGGDRRRRYVDRLRAERPVEEVNEILACALVAPKLEGDLREYREFLMELPEYPEIALFAADEEFEGGRWGAAQDLLRSIDPSGFDDRRMRHYQTLFGLFHLRDGRREEALEALRRGAERLRGECRLESLIDLIEPMPDPPAAADWDPRQPVARQVMGAVRVADRALAASDPAAARGALERPAFWQARSLQAAARLAAAHLATDARTPAERLDKRLALAFFLHLHEPPGGVAKESGPQLLEVPWCQDLLFADLVWDRDRLGELASRCRDWLAGN